MGLIEGKYDAKESGFLPGGASLHNCMSGHGPDAATYEKARRADTQSPQYCNDGMAFMFETRAVICPTALALGLPQLQSDYQRCWEGLPKHFSPTADPSREQ
jgi:homogentisate 1,2-dioxygenase